MKKVDDALPDISGIALINGALESMLLTDGFRNFAPTAIASQAMRGDRETCMGLIFLGFTALSLLIEKGMRGKGTRLCLAATDFAEDTALILTGLVSGNWPQAFNGLFQILGDVAASMTDPIFHLGTAKNTGVATKPLKSMIRKHAADIAFGINVLGSVPMLLMPGDESLIMRTAATGWLLTSFLRWRDDKWVARQPTRESTSKTVAP